MTSTGLAGPKVVALGGGHGLAASLEALRDVAGRLTAVVTVADDGGSSGRLRKELGVMPPGDLRMALAALCGDDDWGRTWARVLQHRFDSEGELQNHAAGNLLIVALWQLLGETVEGLDWVGRLLGARGRVLPMSLQGLEIAARVRGPERGPDGVLLEQLVIGQHEVAVTEGEVISIEIIPASATACPESLAAIDDADWVVLGPGSWYTSVIPHVLVRELRQALLDTDARKALVLNLDPERGETSGFTPERHLEVLRFYAPGLDLDVVVADSGSVADTGSLREAVEDSGAHLVLTDVAAEGGDGNHDPAKLALAFASTFGRGRIAPWR